MSKRILMEKPERELEELMPPQKRLALQPSNDCEGQQLVTDAKMLLHQYQPELVQYIKLESLIPYLNQQHLLTDGENSELLNLVINEHMCKVKLVEFMVGKGPEGFQRFLTALAEEKDHREHVELSKIFSIYRVTMPSTRALECTSVKAIANQVVLHAAMKPTEGIEFDVEERSVEAALKRECPHVSSNTIERTSSQVEYEDIKEHLDHDHIDSASTSSKVVSRYPNLVFPSGPMKKKSHAVVYQTLFKMAWGGEEEKAHSLMTRLRRDQQVSVDLKIVSMEVVHTVNAERDLKVLTSALAFTDRAECENTTILKCRLHRRIAGLHYRNSDLDEANEHMETAVQLAHNIGPDIDTIFTWRLKALMLFEDYKKTKKRECYRDANKYFTKAMDHARQQPETKRIVTERIKVSKALFHLDMREEYHQQNKAEDTLEELQLRAQDTLDDIDEEYLTNGDKAFYYLTRAKLLVLSQEWKEAKMNAEKSLEINITCGFEKRAKEAQCLLEEIRTE